MINKLHNKTQSKIAEILWGNKANLLLLFCASIVVVLFFLGTKTIWTQEWRWANIIHGMIVRHDYFHPYLANQNYYDKPLLSYWLMLGCSWFFGHLSTWAIRLPSALAGLLTVWCTYHIGHKLSSKQTGMMAAWMLISCYFFIFWSRVANTDMLNVAGIMFALVVYFKYREKPTLLGYITFFLTLSIACQLKGIVAAAIVILVLIPDLLYKNNWRKHLKLGFFIGVILGLFIYLLPFWLSAHFNVLHYRESGLTEVFRENILRFFHPFDHKGPIYLYLIYFPLFIAPWIILLIPAVLNLPKRWRLMNASSRWYAWSVLLIFIFFTASGSRRYYYILPIVPFAMLFIADWLHHKIKSSSKWNTFAGILTITFFTLNVLLFVILIPASYMGGGVPVFAQDIQHQAIKQQPWKNWKITIVESQSKTSFYLNSSHLIKFANPDQLNSLLAHPSSSNILIIGANIAKKIKIPANKFIVIYTKPTLGMKVLKNIPDDIPVGLIPK